MKINDLSKSKVPINDGSLEFLELVKERVKKSYDRKNLINIDIMITKAKKRISELAKSYEKKYKVIATQELNNDSNEIAEWYLDIVDKNAASKLLDDIGKTLKSLQIFPESHKIFNESIPEVRKINVFNHKVSILYRVNNNLLEVIAIMAFHEMNNPNKIKEKILSRL